MNAGAFFKPRQRTESGATARTSFSQASASAGSASQASEIRDSSSINSGLNRHGESASLRKDSRPTLPPHGKFTSEERAAAVVIQKHYRGYVDRKMVRRMHMESSARWDDLVKQTGQVNYAEQQLENRNDVRSRWKRGVHAASRLQTGQALYSPPTRTSLHSTTSSIPESAEGGVSDGPSPEYAAAQERLASGPPTPRLDKKTLKNRRARFWGKMTLPPAGAERDEGEELPYRSKALEQQHWLEMVDAKHRYGSNLKYYFRKWKEAETQDNFFRWLDRGDGKDLDLEELPRERLEKEKITYLSAEQRLNYLVRIDDQGLLRWEHNGDLASLPPAPMTSCDLELTLTQVDTAASKWKDSGNGTGIIPDENYTGPSVPKKHLYASSRGAPVPQDDAEGGGTDSDSASSFSSDSYGAGSELQENEATHYDEYDAREGEGKSWWERKVKGITPSGMKKELLRKTVRANTWIYVSDMKMNMFVGIKQTGTFQHSSFIAGGKVTSAGIIVVKHGVIKKLNPWSGHYRSTIAHYRAFIAQLEHKGADLSHVKVGKSVMHMWGLAKYSKVVKGPRDVGSVLKRVLNIEDKEPNDDEKSAEVMANGRRQEREMLKSRGQIQEEDAVRDSPAVQGNHGAGTDELATKVSA